MAQNQPPKFVIGAGASWMNGLTPKSTFNGQTAPPSIPNTVQRNALTPVNMNPNLPTNGNSMIKDVTGAVRDANHNELPKKQQTKRQKKPQRRQNGGGDANDDDPAGDNAANVLVDDKAEDQLAVAETYAEYKPAKLKIGAPHPDAVVETATLSSIEPNDITYELSIPNRIIDRGLLSALQLESIVYSAQAHERILPNGTRGGFLIGDGAGVGKGRTVAGIIFENFQKGRKKAIWISVSNDLKYDAERDLEDIRALDINVYHLNKMKYEKIDSKLNGRIREGVIFSTYASLIAQSNSKHVKADLNSRLKLLVDWCGRDFDGVIIFDECHKAKHLMPSAKGKSTKTGEAVLKLQEQLPYARIVYASATGASEPRNMAYMVRLGLWGQGTSFNTFAQFLQTVERRGVSAMEIVAMDMKLRGMYIARQLSFKGVEFKVEEVPLTPEFVKTFNDCVALWAEAREKFEVASVLLGDNHKTAGNMKAQFWAAHQRFFKYLCIASKVSHVVKLAKEAVANGKCAVIGLQSTGEARTLSIIERDDGELEDFVSTAKAVLENLIEKQFPAPSRQWQRANKVKYTKKPNLARDALNRLDDTDDHSERNASKRPRVIHSDDSDEEPTTEKEFNADKDASESDTDSDSDSYQSSGRMSDFLDDEASDDDDDSDTDMKSYPSTSRRRRRRAPANKSASKHDSTASTMQSKVMESVNKQLSDPENAELNPIALNEMCKRACLMRDELLDKLEQLSDRLPCNTLDQLIDELGGPEEVAELTGRKGRVVKNEHGEVEYESRCQGECSMEKVNLYEKDLFMNGEKLIAIISEAASNGISLQSDRRAKNHRRRVHITLELPWSADKAIQQFGRTHRSNQVSAPEYIFLISNLAGERRFASSVSKRLESLGALTHGDRRATETRNLSQFNVENKYGVKALHTVLKHIMLPDPRTGTESPEEIERLETFEQIEVALKDVGIGKSTKAIKDVTIPMFLNRILGVPVKLQNDLFDYFMETVDAEIQHAKDLGQFDLGIMDLGNTDNAQKLRWQRFMRESITGIAPIDVTTVALERGITWADALEKSKRIVHEREGFYRTKWVSRTGKRLISLVLLADAKNDVPVLDSTSKLKMCKVEFQKHHPHTGTQARLEPLDEILRKNTKITEQEAHKHWESLYDFSLRQCSHMYQNGRCLNKLANEDCDVGMSRRRYTVISGSLFTHWSKIEHYKKGQLRVIRLKMTDGTKIVGVLIPENNVDDIMKDLRDTSLSEEDKIEW